MGKREIDEPGRQRQARLLAQVTTGNRREYAAIPSNPQVRNRITLRMKLPVCTSVLALSLKKKIIPKAPARQTRGQISFHFLPPQRAFAFLAERAMSSCPPDFSDQFGPAARAKLEGRSALPALP